MNAEPFGATSEQRFRQHFDGVVRAKLDEVNAYRRRTLRSVLLAWAVIVSGLFGTGFVATQVDVPGSVRDVVLWVLALALLVSLALSYAKFYNPYRKSFKDRFVAPLVHAYREGMVYSPDGEIQEEEFNESGMFRERRTTHFSGEDRIDGVIGETKFRFSEVDAENRVSYTGSDGKEKTSKHPIFRGLFYVAEFNKHFSGTTYVFPDRAERLLGSLGQSLQSGETPYGALVKLEDPEFERQFVVYSSSQIEARYILSSALMQRLVALRVRTGKRLRIGFSNSKLFVAIASRKNHFEPHLFRLIDADAFREYWDVLDTFVAIVDDLNLNTRIWTKVSPKKGRRE